MDGHRGGAKPAGNALPIDPHADHRPLNFALFARHIFNRTERDTRTPKVRNPCRLLIRAFSEGNSARLQAARGGMILKLVNDGLRWAGLTYASAAPFRPPRA